MDIVYKPEDETTTHNIASGPNQMVSRVAAPTVRLFLTTMTSWGAYLAIDIQTGRSVAVRACEPVIIRPGVWCEDCAECPKAKEVM